MSDDSPWRPPSDDAPAPELRAVEPSLPDAPAPDAPAVEPSLPDASPVVPPPPTAPPMPPAPSMPPPGIPVDARASSVADAPFGDPGDAPLISAPPERSKRSKWLVGGAAAAVVAVGAAGVFAVSNLTQTSRGGAESAEELGFSLLEAFENEDVLGVIDVLSPGERDVFRDPMVDLVSELTRLEVLSPDADLSKLLGVDVEFSDESVTAVSTNVADIVNIDLRAGATITFDGAEVPIGDLITDNLPDDVLTELRGTRLTEADELDVRLTAIEQDGRWYFSVFHTIAEYARAEVSPGTLIPAEGIGADPADTPEAAVDQLLDRVESLDLTGLLRTLNPGEAAALQRYAPLFLDEAEAELDAAPLTWEITRRDVRIEGSGNRRTVHIDAFGVDGNFDGDAFSVEFADGCLKASAAGDSFEACETELWSQAQWAVSPSDTPEIAELIDTITEAFSDIEEAGLELVQNAEGWYISPVATGSEGFLSVLRALDRSELDAIIDQVPPAIDEFSEVLFGGLNGLPGSPDLFETIDSVADQPFDDAVTVATVPGGSVATVAPEELGWEKCYTLELAAEAGDCFSEMVANGSIDPLVVPVVLRYPECGYEEGWEGSIYSMSDAEFVAAVEESRPCFLALVESGEVSDWELPSEIANFECFEGRNWYNTFGDDDYDARYFECLDRAYEDE